MYVVCCVLQKDENVCLKGEGMDVKIYSLVIKLPVVGVVFLIRHTTPTTGGLITWLFNHNSSKRLILAMPPAIAVLNHSVFLSPRRFSLLCVHLCEH